MQGCKRPSQVIHDLSLGSHVIRASFRLLVRYCRLTEDARRHPIIIRGQVFDLLCESMHTDKLACGRGERDFSSGIASAAEATSFSVLLIQKSSA